MLIESNPLKEITIHTHRGARPTTFTHHPEDPPLVAQYLPGGFIRVVMNGSGAVLFPASEVITVTEIFEDEA